jgi:predicted transcriptional regulator
MNHETKQQPHSRVSDVMTQKVVEIPAHETMAGTAEILRKFDVSGAPVIDQQGRCVGVISGTDFTKQESLSRITATAAVAGLNYRVAPCDAAGFYYIEETAAGDVENYMSMLVQTISSDATLREAARAMCHHHIHRLIVLDAAKRPVGVLSSLDLVRVAFSLTPEDCDS